MSAETKTIWAILIVAFMTIVLVKMSFSHREEMARIQAEYIDSREIPKLYKEKPSVDASWLPWKNT